MMPERVPDILFLDVEMPGKSGFDLLNDLRKPEIQPCIIFQTAFDKYAIEAIKNAAFDYLLKPVDREAILTSLSRYKARKRQYQLGNQIADLLTQPGIYFVCLLRGGDAECRKIVLQ
jgi:DNA-binding LytR/AlgR family response regulator